MATGRYSDAPCATLARARAVLCFLDSLTAERPARRGAARCAEVRRRANASEPHGRDSDVREWVRLMFRLMIGLQY